MDLPHSLEARPSEARAAVRAPVRSIADRFQPTHNNFDLLRLLAAISVLVSHSFSLTHSPDEPYYKYLGGYDTGGGIAVSVFFVISGFLVTRSLQSRSVENYLLARVLRILPALALVTLFETFVVGPIFFHGTLRQYFASGALDHLLNMFVFFMRLTIPGVFTDLPHPGMNGSLWSIPAECTFYLLLPFLGLAFFRYRWTVFASRRTPWRSLSARPGARC